MDVNLADNPGLNEKKLKFSLVEIKKKFGISRDALYSRMRYLQISTWKEPNGKAYLDAEQMSYMEELDAHMKANNGRMEGYPIPQPSGPQSSITTTTTGQVTRTEQSEELTPERVHSPNVIDLQGVHDAGMSKAIGIILAENAIAHQYLTNPELLPDEWLVSLVFRHLNIFSLSKEWAPSISRTAFYSGENFVTVTSFSSYCYFWLAFKDLYARFVQYKTFFCLFS